MLDDYAKRSLNRRSVSLYYAQSSSLYKVSLLLGVSLTRVCCVSSSSESGPELRVLAARFLGKVKEKATQLGNQAKEAMTKAKSMFFIVAFSYLSIYSL